MEEAIRYQLLTFVLKGNLLSFAAYKNHIGISPVPSGDEKFNEKLPMYRDGKATVRFPLEQSIPYDLVRQIVKWRVEKMMAKLAVKAKKG